MTAASTDWRDVRGPFDIIGDVHGCADELVALLAKLGYGVQLAGTGDARRATTTAPKGRRAFFVGDLVDRGPNSPDVLRIVMGLVERGQAFAVIGNHDDKFLRWLKGRDVKIANGLERTIAQIEDQGEAIKTRAVAFLDALPSHAWLDDGNLAVAHAGVRENMLGRDSPRAHDFGLYGDTSGGTDAAGLPERFNWAADYRRQDRCDLRPYAGGRGGMAQQYDVHRHGLRVRRQADGPTLAGARTCLGAGTRGVRGPAPRVWPAAATAARASGTLNPRLRPHIDPL